MELEWSWDTILSVGSRLTSWNRYESDRSMDPIVLVSWPDEGKGGPEAQGAAEVPADVERREYGCVDCRAGDSTNGVDALTSNGR